MADAVGLLVIVYFCVTSVKTKDYVCSIIIADYVGIFAVLLRISVYVYYRVDCERYILYNGTFRSLLNTLAYSVDYNFSIQLSWVIWHLCSIIKFLCCHSFWRSSLFLLVIFWLILFKIQSYKFCYMGISVFVWSL